MDPEERPLAILVMLAQRARAAKRHLRRARQQGDPLVIAYQEGSENEAWNALQAAKAVD